MKERRAQPVYPILSAFPEYNKPKKKVFSDTSRKMMWNRRVGSPSLLASTGQNIWPTYRQSVDLSQTAPSQLLHRKRCVAWSWLHHDGLCCPDESHQGIQRSSIRTVAPACFFQSFFMCFNFDCGAIFCHKSAHNATTVSKVLETHIAI